MKASALLLTLLGLLTVASPVPAAELVIDNETLLPSSTLELRFDNAMIGKEKVGTVEKTSPLVSDPAVEGEFKWTSTRSGQFHFTKAPAISTTYSFTLRKGLKDATGKAVAVEELGEYETEAFRVADDYKEYPYSFGDSARRTPVFLLQFSDEIDAAVAERQFHFVSRFGTQPIPAKVRLATGKDFKKRYGTDLVPTWDEQAKGVKPTVKDDETRPNAVIVQTSEPLPPGVDWTLVMPADFTNAGGNAILGEEARYEWGSVQVLAFKNVETENHFDGPHTIGVNFNKSIRNSGLSDTDLEKARVEAAKYVTVEPAVPDMKVNLGWSSLEIEGNFALDTPYTVTVNSGLPGADELPLENAVRQMVTFKASPVFVSTSAGTSTQLSTGNGLLDIYGANFKEMRIRAKQLSDADLLQARTLYDQEYERFDYSEKNKTPARERLTPFEKLPGKVVFEKVITNTQPLERGSLHSINWRDALGQTAAAPLFLEIEAVPQDGAPAGAILNRSIVEFTDIGLMVKNTGEEALVYAFSLKTGKALPGVQLTLADVGLNSLKSAQTDDKGMAVVPSQDAEWVLAKSGDDCTASLCNGRQNRVGIWGHDINIGWGDPWKAKNETFIFADRPVYKPGEKANVKAITRLRTGDALTLGQPTKAKLTMTDPRNREVLNKEITFTANGTWSDQIALPDGAVGWYSLNIRFREPKEGEDEYETGALVNLALRVDEYKPNTFEVKLDGEKFQVGKDRIKVPLKANYYMGKALSSAKATWSAGLVTEYTPPDEFAEYHFGDAPAWWHYGKDRDDETASEDEDEDSNSWGAHGELTLNDDGTASIELPPPPAHKQALPQTISVYADVTDVNQQTIAANTEFKIPGADFIVGTKTRGWYGSAGKDFAIDFVAITPQGKGFTAPVPVEVKLERQEWNTVRVQGAGGAMTTKNQSVLVEEWKSQVELKSVNGGASAAELKFTPKTGGTYFLTSTATDANGKTVLSRRGFYVLGSKDFPWAFEDGARITLQPDKTTAKPGEEVSVVVKSPIAGTALVTVERNRIHRQFTAPVSPENPVVKVPITDEDAPNAYISVVVIRGADQSPQPDKMPEYKVGYCEIGVESNTKKLVVTTEAAQPSVLPNGQQTLTATVKDGSGKPVEGGEVTFFAVDEGVLSLMEFETPKPFEFFHAAKSLYVSTYTTLDALLTEKMADRYRGNKGIMVGGGDAEIGADMALRKNFVATAVWQASLITDKDGKVTTTFNAPDSLTRYRVMAIAAKDGDRFGTGESAFVVNKPLMVEPVVPRFAHTGDEILVKAVVHNTTQHSGQVEVELQLDDHAQLITEERPFALVGLKNRTTTNDGKSERRVITLKAGETTALAFPVRFVKNGPTTWKWQAKTTEWSDAKALGDAVESKFDVHHPVPALREVHYLQLTSASASQDMLKGVNPQLLESNGELRIDFNQSRLSEARDALQYLLEYPYGCVEQTTSATLPWLALSKYEPMFPDLLQKDKVRDVITRGVNRILQMQTDDGGLAYWPGGETPELWASAYGGHCLFKAKEWGIPIPQASLDSLTDWISKQLRELDLAKTTESDKLNDAAMALYTLARAGKAEPAYATTLYTRREKMPETARLFLALSMCLTKAPDAQITELLKPQKNDAKAGRFWLGGDTAAGLRLIVCADRGLTKEANLIADELMKRRNGGGHWGTTFSNSWILTGLSTLERPVKDPQPLNFSVAIRDQEKPFALAHPLDTTTAMLNFTSKKDAPTAKVTLPQDKTLRARVEVKAWPELKTFQPVQKGFGVTRRYERLTPTGMLEPAENLRVGDLIVVTLDINVMKGNRYLALEDRLPSVFEPVNPEFTTQNKKKDADAEDNAWYCDHRELRHDRALFFTNDWSTLGKFQLKYLARVIAEGDVVAPPARIEAMYDPSHYGTSGVQRVQTLPMSDGKNVAGQ
ncbi:alpha-2-macroglobulin family protein [Roseimicrobium sp. ORNL1]|uniref:alpha-2-macroglobulin family protein n=1 Tax=Roseimicrobium sp. ORNL1 TaxID=2711231 RepID=UPI0013E183C1|nr:alpha-2-macroglobulin family protein [Roseimicrobium sp. ORNL1]QIF02758.1 hypothetical protein G5S37_14915 [Roseimicrobium sp. ORNL1]